MTLTEDSVRQRDLLLEAVKRGVEADRNNARKWDPLYLWFDTQLGIKGGTSAGVIGKVITERKQIGNRIDEMDNRFGPKYAVISLLGDVTIDEVLRVMRKKGKPSTLLCILFFENLRAAKLVVFDE